MTGNPQIKANEVVTKTLDNLAASPTVNISEASADRMKPAIIKEMTSVIVNQTNQEPWYQSRVTIGALVSAAAGIAGLAGFAFSAEDQAYWVDSIEQGIEVAVSAAALIGGAYAWYGRWRAKKPIGE